MIIPEKTLGWGRARSCIRELAEYGAVRKREIGIENVYDYSLGNPSVPAPDSVNEAIIDIVNNTDSVALHGYTTAAGLYGTRKHIAEDLVNRFGIELDPEHIYITCGAAASLTITLRSILMPGEEVIVPAPFFPEYRVFTEASGGKLVIVPPGKGMMMNLPLIEEALSENTKAVLINSPNNPSGAIFDEENLKGLAEILKKAEAKYGHEIFLISDEPYRELVYDAEKCHTALEYYDDSIMCYSFSKSLSVPGERIGYIAVNGKMKEKDTIYAAVMGAGRALGFVNPPSLFQRVIDRCIGQTSDISKYKENRDILCEALSEYGYKFTKPQGAFYLFMESPIPDAKAFSEAAKKYDLLIVPSDDFGVPGYIRLAYCVSKDMIIRSLPAFKKLIDDFK